METTWTLSIGRQTLNNQIKWPYRRVATIEEGSKLYCQMRDESGEGGSTFPNGKLVSGPTTYWISYNGKVWSSKPSFPIDPHALVYSPYA